MTLEFSRPILENPQVENLMTIRPMGTDLFHVDRRDRTISHHHHHLALQPFVGFCLLRQVSPSSSVLSYFLPVFTFSFFKSSTTSSCHRCLGLPTGLVPIGFQSNSFLGGLAWSILCIWPSHLYFLCLNGSHYICTFY